MVLGDCESYMKCASGGKGGASGKNDEIIRVLSNNFLNVMWDARK